ncbi:MAG: hypothetical protein JW822_07865 [Spirochaetales bacterium]|nr:hypothetical protein [Spirochaetales bacterium]
MLNKEQVFSLIKPLLWDYKISTDEVYALLTGEKVNAGPFTFNHLFIRLLERLPWYDLVSIFGMHNIKLLLVPEIINMIRDKELRKRYEFIGKVLRGETVSFTGWSLKSRERVKHTLLSHRWYSLK